MVLKLNNLGQRVSDMRPMWAQLHKRFVGETHRIFLTRGGNKPWPALDRKYAKWKARKFPGKPMMRRTERLFLAAIGRSDDSIKEMTPTSATFGVDTAKVPYARAAQSRRSYIRIESVTKHLAKVASEWVRQILRRTF